jgi:hypothetical protein
MFFMLPLFYYLLKKYSISVVGEEGLIHVLGFVKFAPLQYILIIYTVILYIYEDTTINYVDIANIISIIIMIYN